MATLFYFSWVFVSFISHRYDVEFEQITFIKKGHKKENRLTFVDLGNYFSKYDYVDQGGERKGS